MFERLFETGEQPPHRCSPTTERPEIGSQKLVEAMDVDETIYARINEAYGTDYKLRR